MKKGNYVLAAIDLQLFGIAMLDLEHWIRIIACIGGLIVTVYTIRKMRQDYDINKIAKRNLELDQQIKEQQLAREIVRNLNQNLSIDGTE
jgi:hypothetical protein